MADGCDADNSDVLTVESDVAPMEADCKQNQKSKENSSHGNRGGQSNSKTSVTNNITDDACGGGDAECRSQQCSDLCEVVIGDESSAVSKNEKDSTTVSHGEKLVEQSSGCSNNSASMNTKNDQIADDSADEKDYEVDSAGPLDTETSENAPLNDSVSNNKLEDDNSKAGLAENMLEQDSESTSSEPINDSGVFTTASESPATDTVSSLSCEQSKEVLDNDMDTESVALPSVPKDNLSDSSSHDDDDDDNDSVIEPSRSSRSVTRRKRRVMSSSSSSESDNEDNDNDDDDVSSKSPKSSTTENSDSVSEMPTVKQNWFALPQLSQRELGYGNRICTSKFSESTYSSVHLVKRMKLHHKMHYHEGCVNALNFNTSGTLLASGSDDLNVCIWKWYENTQLLTFDSGHRSNVFQTKFLPYSGDCHVVTSSRDGQIRLAELSITGVCKGTKKLAQHKGSAHKLTLLPDDSHVLLSCGEDAVVFEIDLREEKPHRLATVKENNKKVPLYSINSNPGNTQLFCTGGRDHFIRIYDRRKITDDDEGPVMKYCPQNMVNEDNMKANVTCAVFNYNGTEVLGTYNDEDIYLFDTSHSEGADYIHRFKGHRNNATVKEVNFYGPCSEYVVSGSDCGNIFMWDKQTENIVQYLHADDAGVVNVLAPHPTMPFLATSGLDHDVKIWSPSAYEPTKLVDLKETMDKNATEREDERSHHPEMIDGQMLWLLMHLRRSARRRERAENGEEFESSSDESDSDSDAAGGEDDDEDDGGRGRLGCAPS